MIDSILSIINKFIPDKDEANKVALELNKEVTKQMELKSDIIQEEARNGSGKWRVKLMYLCMIMVASHFIMYWVIPYIVTIFDLNVYTPQAPEDSHLWNFLEIGVGGYIGSRGIEKSVAHWRRK